MGIYFISCSACISFKIIDYRGFVLDTEKKLTVLSTIAKELNSRGVFWAVGASVLLYFNGIVRDFHDIDLMVDSCDSEVACQALAALGEMLPAKSQGRYRSEHFSTYLIDGVEVDLIAGYKIVNDGVIYSFPLNRQDVTGTAVVNDTLVPLHSLSVWQRCYELMERPEKARLIAEHLKNDRL